MGLKNQEIPDKINPINGFEFLILIKKGPRIGAFSSI